jgi:hypothetical protein
MSRNGHKYNIGDTLMYTGSREYSQKSLINKEGEVTGLDYSTSSGEPMYKMKFFHYNYHGSLLPDMMHCVFEGNVTRKKLSWVI